ncbi:hypothetical protein WKI71_34645 [Streptomyces sp. MS1.AVA.1]|uniref:Uncharacterized protein n=1 Tax=Streptomyces machairae TaxID=3134109 RepID=A0ABU8URW3_9ACTN
MRSAALSPGPATGSRAAGSRFGDARHHVGPMVCSRNQLGRRRAEFDEASITHS